MEISPTKTAKLVLGYLRSVNCISACKEFLRTSSDLKECASKLKKEKYIVTRVDGLSLQDILREYSEISALVQGRLEASNFYDEKRSKSSLSEQLSYLLDNAKNLRMETPIPFSRCSTPYQPMQFQQQYSPTDSISHELMHDKLNATQLKNLPGYSGFERFSKKKSPIKTTQPQEEAPPNEVLNLSSQQQQIITQKLLDHQELCEKLAENINAAYKPSHSNQLHPEDTPNSVLQKELDAKIKNISKKTAEDPMFETLLCEIIGSTENELNRSSEKENVIDSVQPNIKMQEVEKQNASFGSKLSKGGRIDDDAILASYNNDAIESLIAVSKNSLPTNKNLTNVQNAAVRNQTEQPSSDVNKVLNINTSPGEIILYNGTMDNYINSSKASKSMIINQNGLLMVQPSGSNLESTSVSNVGPSNSCYIINGQPMYPVQQQCNVIGEQDIMNMPTVFINQTTTIPAQPVEQKLQMKSAKGRFILPALKNPQHHQVEILSEQILAPKTIKILPPAKVDKRPIATKTKIENKVHPKIIKQNTKEPIINLTNQTKPSSETEKTTGPQVTPDLTIQGTKKTTPKSGSHVRQLNFNNSPPKNINFTQKSPVSSRKVLQPVDEEPETSTTKTENSKSALSWDVELRAFAKSNDESASPVKRKKCKTKKPPKKPEVQLNTTETEGEIIEKELLKECSEVQASQSKISPKPVKKVYKGKKTLEVEKPEQAVTASTSVNDMRFGLKNVNAKANIKKKCNIENSKKDHKTTKVKEIKLIEIVADASNKMVLSPSKLNASKRSIVGNEATTSRLEQSEENKLLTPEILKIDSIQPMNAKCNLIPMLETPLKAQPIMKADVLPKTPGIFSPVKEIDTPFTKVIKENMKGIDLNSIQTPSFPLTPSFPITPQVIDSNYSNRPTDYSTSSSYYQPSDSEQNKSLEKQIIEECKRLEATSPMKKKNKFLCDKNKFACVPSKSIDNTVEKSSVTDQNKINTNSSSNTQKEEPKINPIICNINAMKTNFMGRKNLQLVRPSTEVLNSSTSSEDYSDSDGSSSNSSEEEYQNKTIIENSESKEKPATRFSMRLRSKLNASVEDKSKENALAIKEIIQSAPAISRTTNKVTTAANRSEQILKDLDEKRKRTIAKFKENSVPAKRVKKCEAKPLKCVEIKKKPIVKKTEVKGTPKVEVKSPQIVADVPSSTKTNNSRETSLNQDNSKKEILFHLSDDDDFESIDFLSSSKLETNNDKNTSEDTTAGLVEHLQQRGIHLIPKNTSDELKPNQQMKETIEQEETTSQKNEDSYKPLNLSVNKNKPNIEKSQTEVSNSSIAAPQKEIVNLKQEPNNKSVKDQEQQSTSQDINQLLQLKKDKLNIQKRPLKDKRPQIVKEKIIIIPPSEVKKILENVPEKITQSEVGKEKKMDNVKRQITKDINKTKQVKNEKLEVKQKKEEEKTKIDDICAILQEKQKQQISGNKSKDKIETAQTSILHKEHVKNINNKGDDLEDGEILSDNEVTPQVDIAVPIKKRRMSDIAKCRKTEKHTKNEEKLQNKPSAPKKETNSNPNKTKSVNECKYDEYKNSKIDSKNKIINRRKSIFDEKKSKTISSSFQPKTQSNTNVLKIATEQEANKFSPLEDLYPNQPSRYNQKKPQQIESRRITNEDNKKSEKEFREKEDKHNNTQNLLLQENKKHDTGDKKKEITQIYSLETEKRQENVESKRVDHIENEKKKIEGAICSSQKSNNLEEEKKRQQKLEIPQSSKKTENVVIVSNKGQETPKNDQADDLMDLAITITKTTGSRKRKAPSDGTEELINKKSAQEILRKNVDVDQFLEVLHNKD